MKILVSGSSGFIGTSLVPFLKNYGHQVTRLVRNKTETKIDSVFWNPDKSLIDKTLLEGFDAVIHLAGENVHGRWTEEKKQKILSSRIQGTTLLVKTLSELKNPPEVLVCASGVTYYGNKSSEPVDETGSPGIDFLSYICQEWEKVTTMMDNTEVRVVNLRIGGVLGISGGMLEKFVPLIKMGLGATLGNGRQHISWIALDDLLEVIHLVINDRSIKGPVNAVSPNVVTNYEFTKTLGRILARPVLLSLPESLVRLVLGEWVDSTLLADYNVIPKVLLDKKYKFRFSDLEAALRHSLKRR